MNLTGQTLDHKYQILEPIGAGGMSLVYRALDIPRQTAVAVKLMKEKVTSSYLEDFLRFKREIEVISKFNHPGVIEAYDTGEYQNRPYLVTELLEGTSLADLLQLGPGATQINEAVEIVTQIAQALQYVHQHGVIHRDLKPGNVFLLKGDRIRIKLLDFGVAHMIELAALKDETEIVGTFGYMAPEASGILNRKIDERSDLYSLGVVFYHLLTGELPFQGADINQLLHSQAAVAAPRPKPLNSQIAVVLEEIVLKMLQKDPDLRYQSAQGLLADLEKYRQGERKFDIGRMDQKIKLTYQTRLVGREEELKKLRGMVDQASQGKGAIGFIAGEAGIGKSRLVEEIRSYVYQRGGLFIRGRCLNHENKLPYQPFKDALDEYIRGFQQRKTETIEGEKERLRKALGDLGAIVIQLNPRLEPLLGKMKPLIPLEPDRENQRFLMVSVDFFRNLAGLHEFCVLFLDDLQWSDAGSLNLLQELAVKIGGANLLVLGTYRDNEVTFGHNAAVEHGLSRIRGQLTASGARVVEIKLVSFQRPSLQQLVVLLMGETPGNTDELTDFILERSGGNPFFAIHLLRELVESQALFWNDRSWVIDSEKLRAASVSSSIVSLILKRIEGLTKEQTDLLCRAAVIGREFELDLLYRLVDFERVLMVERVDEMIAMQLLEKSSVRGRLIFAHDRIRDAFYQKLTEPELRKIHFEIARVMETANENHRESVAFELVHHYLEAGELDKTLEYIFLAAAFAKVSYANEEAIKYYQKGIELLEHKGRKGGPDWLKASGEMTEVYLTTGKNDEAIMISTVMMPLMEKPLEQARLYRKIGSAYFKKGDWVKCEENLITGLKLLGEKIPNTQIKRGFLSIQELLGYGLRVIFARFFPKPKKIMVTEENREIVWMLFTLTFMYGLSDLSKVIYSSIRALNIAETRLKKSRELGMIYGGFAMTFSLESLFKMAFTYHTKALNIRKELDDPWGEAQSLQFLGLTYLWKGMYSESIAAFTQSEKKFEKIGDLWELGMVYFGLGCGYQYQSEYQKAIEFYCKYLEVSQTIKNDYGIVAAQLELIFCSIGKGNFTGTEEQINRYIIQTQKNKQWLNLCYARICLGFLELERGNFQKAHDALEKAKKVNEENELFQNHIALLYPYLADAFLKKLQTQSISNGYESFKQDMKKLQILCKEALKKTKPWIGYYGAALRVTGDYYTLINKYRTATKYFKKSIEHTKKLNQRYELAKCYFEYGNCFHKANKHERAEGSWFRAYQIFKEIGTEAYRKKCSDLLGLYETRAGRLENPAPRDRLAFERRMDTVFTTGRYLSSILDLDELLHKIIDSAMELVGAERGILMLYPETGGRRLELVVNRNIGREEFQGREFGASRSIINRVVLERKPLLIMDAMADEEFKNKSSVVLMGIRSVMAVPILAKGAFLGVIYLDNHLLSGLFTEEDLKVLDLIAGQAGISIENARFHKENKKSRDEIAAWNRTLEQRVMERTEQLEAANRELQAYASMAEELAVVKERNRIARDVHDTLGQTLSVLVKLLEVSQDIWEINPPQIRKNLAEAVEITRNGLNEVRRSVVGLVWEEGRVANFIDSLAEMIAHFQLSGMKVDFAVDEILPFLSGTCIETIYRVCQEALTNSLKHGKATEAYIILRCDNKLVKLYIFDNGCGCRDFRKSPGFGLRGMRQRVESLRGRIAFGSDGATGFNIHVEIPVEDEKND